MRQAEARGPTSRWIDGAELARRSVKSFGELLAMIGRWGVGEAAVLRRPDAVGMRLGVATDSPWINAAAVPFDAAPPAEDPQLPHCLWSIAGAVPGRAETTGIAMPCMGVVLDDPTLRLEGGAPELAVPSLEVLGELNDRAYGQQAVLGPLLRRVRDDRVRVHGLRDGGAFVCVALTLALGDDIGIHYVATELGHRRRGLASRLLLAVMAAARRSGMRTATLQASPDGLPVYQRLGFHHVATLRAFFRPRLER